MFYLGAQFVLVIACLDKVVTGSCKFFFRDFQRHAALDIQATYKQHAVHARVCSMDEAYSGKCEV